ncbi:unnamed protein product [Arabidopsis halleri]
MVYTCVPSWIYFQIFIGYNGNIHYGNNGGRENNRYIPMNIEGLCRIHQVL